MATLWRLPSSRSNWGRVDDPKLDSIPNERANALLGLAHHLLADVTGNDAVACFHQGQRHAAGTGGHIQHGLARAQSRELNGPALLTEHIISHFAEFFIRRRLGISIANLAPAGWTRWVIHVAAAVLSCALVG